MLPTLLSDRVDGLIDELIMDGGVEAASLASILLASKDSLTGNYLGSLSRLVWTVSSELKADFARERARQSTPWSDAPAEEPRVPARSLGRSGINAETGRGAR